MRISDWSSDVCSSDLWPWLQVQLYHARPGHSISGGGRIGLQRLPPVVGKGAHLKTALALSHRKVERFARDCRADRAAGAAQIGRESCRERWCQYVSILVGAVSSKKNKYANLTM